MSDEKDKHEDQPRSEDSTGSPDSTQPVQPADKAANDQPSDTSDREENSSEPPPSSAGDQNQNSEIVAEEVSSEKDSSRITNDSSGEVVHFDDSLLTEHDKAVLASHEPYSMSLEENPDDDLPLGGSADPEANDAALPPAEVSRVPQPTIDLCRDEGDDRVYVCLIEWPDSRGVPTYGNRIEFGGGSYYKPRYVESFGKSFTSADPFSSIWDD